MPIPVLLTVDQVAEVLQCSPNGVRRMIEDGRLPAVRVPGANGGRALAVRVREDHLEQKIEDWAGSGPVLRPKGVFRALDNTSGVRDKRL